MNISNYKKKKIPFSGTFLIPGISDERYSTCVITLHKSLFSSP